jgi:O-antigen ligase
MGWKYRQMMLRGTLVMIRERPLTGHGIGLYPYYEWKYTGSGLPVSLGGIRPTTGDQAHNLYAQTAAELGVPGLMLLIVAPVTFLVMGIIRLRTVEAGMRRALLMGAMGAIVAFMVDAFGSPAWQFSQISLFYWLILGLGVNCLRTVVKSAEPAAAKPAPIAARLIAMAVVLVGLSVLLPTVAVAVDPVLP